jgi:hypothetical protein
MTGKAYPEPFLIEDGRMEAINYAHHPNHNSIWAMATGDDGKIYVGVCCEGNAPISALLYQYDPATKVSRLIYDLGVLTDNPPARGHMPHSKLHTCLCPAKDGKVWAAAHNTAPALGDPLWSMPASYHDRHRHYPGGHIVVYDPSTDESRDLGLVVPFDPIYVLRIDREHERLFGVTMMTYQIVIYDIKADSLRLYEPVADNIPFGAFADKWGNWYMSDDDGRLIRWTADEDRFVPLNTWLPPMRAPGKNWMSYGVTDEQGCLWGLTGWTDPHLFRYDPHDGPEGRMDSFGPAWPDRAPEGPRRGRVRGLVLGCDQRAYYVVSEYPRVPELRGARVNIACYDPVTDTHADMGVAHAEGRISTGLCEGCLGPDGVIYYGEVNRGPTRVLAYHPPYLSPPCATGRRRRWADSPELREWEAWVGANRERWEVEFGKPVERNHHRYLPGARLVDPERFLVRLGPDDPLGEIAWYESAIQALVLGAQRLVYGATGGWRAHLFSCDGQQVRPLGLIADSEAEVTGLVALADGTLVGSVLTKSGAALFRYAVDGAPERMSAALPGQGAVRLCADSQGTVIFGMAAGSGDLFRFDPATEEVTCLGRAPGEPPSPALICDNQGNVFGASDWGRLFRLDAKTAKLEQLELYLPHMAYRRFLAGWSAAVRLEDGTICGGTAGDGMLFLLDPVTLTMLRRGKPTPHEHIQSLALGADGTVWGLSGQRDDICHVFSHDPRTGESADEGAVGWKVRTLAVMGEALVLGEKRTVSRLIIIRATAKST